MSKPKQHPPIVFTALQPEFLRLFNDNGESFEVVESIDQAQGVRFLCPLCFHRNDGPRGTHSVICWSRSKGVPEHVKPKPGRWKMVGTGLHDLTLHGDPGPDGFVQNMARSVLLNGGCGWHGYVTGGLVTAAE